MKVYNVFHQYETHCGGDDKCQDTELIATFESREDADAFVYEFANPHVYDEWYPSLSCGELYVKEQEIISHDGFDLYSVPSSYWWLPPADIEIDNEDEIIGYCKSFNCACNEEDIRDCISDKSLGLCSHVWEKWVVAHNIDKKKLKLESWRKRNEG